MTDTGYQKFGDALNNLKKAHAFLLSVQRGDLKLVENDGAETPKQEMASLEETAKASAVVAFNLCHEMLWVHLKKFILADMPETQINSPKGIYKLALKGGFITTDMAESLNRYLAARIKSTHDYAEQKGDIVLDVTADFIEDATELYEMMTEQ